MSRKRLELEDYNGAICVMENYLDGALADYENGDVENDYLIDSCIKTIELIYANTNPILLYASRDYRERFEKAKAKRGQKDVL